jgi:hypothetical protein
LARQAGEEDEDSALPASKRMTLLPRFKKLPVKRVVALQNVTGDTRLTVSYDDAGTGLLPSGAPGSEIASFLIRGMEDVAAKYNATGKVGDGQGSLKFNGVSTGVQRGFNMYSRVHSGVCMSIEGKAFDSGEHPLRRGGQRRDDPGQGRGAGGAA